MSKASDTKKEIRTRINKIRQSFSKEKIIDKSRRVISQLLDFEQYKNANSIMSYISLDFEVNTKEFIKNELSKANKEIFVPFLEEDKIKVSRMKKFNNIVKGNYGVLEPKNKDIYEEGIDIILVPGTAFDKKGRRIGFGKGYYDSFLKQYLYSLKIGIAFEEQIVDLIPEEEHDVQMDMIITDKRIIKCS